MGYVPQAHVPPFAFTVEEVALMGRTAHLGLFDAPSAADHQRAVQALEALGIGHLRARPYTEISGGERQMTLIARALTQEPKVLVLDEPTSNLDFGNQARLLDRILALAKGGLAVLMTTHDPDHAFACGASTALLRPGCGTRFGGAAEVLDEASLWGAYGVEVRILRGAGGPGREVTACVPMLGGMAATTKGGERWKASCAA
jgi:iron complex transport system ATP-binding protein